jgi:hypothetical protein
MPAAHYLARKIQISRWERKSYSKDDADVRADSLTGRCLKTDNEELSVWACENRKDDVAEIALALTADPQKTSRLERVVIVLLNREQLTHEGFVFKPEHGTSLVADLNSRHVNISELDLYKLVRIAAEITLKVRNNLLFYQFTAKEIRSLVMRAVSDGRIEESALPENLKPK